MKHPVFKLLLPLLIATSVACSGSDEQAHDDVNHGGDGGDGFNGDGDGDGDGAPADNDLGDGGDGNPADNDGDTDACAYEAGCPAPELCAKQVLIFDDMHRNGWSSFGFSGGIDTETGTVCSGTGALRYASHRYDGIGFSKSSPIAAAHLSMRVNVSENSTWTVSAQPEEADAHCYRLPVRNCGEGFSCPGGTQHVAPCLLHWTAGWQTVELDIPWTDEPIKSIFFELQSDPAGSTTTLIVDDMRLTTP